MNVRTYLSSYIFSKRPDLQGRVKIYTARRGKNHPFYIFSLHSKGVHVRPDREYSLFLCISTKDETTMSEAAKFDYVFMCPSEKVPEAITMSVWGLRCPKSMEEYLVGENLILENLPKKIPTI